MNRRRFLALATGATAGLAGCLGDAEYAVADVSTAASAGPLAFDVSVADAAVTVDSPGLLDVTLRNDGESAVDVRSTGVWPFGTLGLRYREENRSYTVPLLSDQYAETDRVEIQTRGGGEWSARGSKEPIVRSLGAGDAVTERYEVHGSLVRRTGAYDLQGYFEPVPFSVRAGEGSEWAEVDLGTTVELEQTYLPR